MEQSSEQQPNPALLTTTTTIATTTAEPGGEATSTLSQVTESLQAIDMVQEQPIASTSRVLEPPLALSSAFTQLDVPPHSAPAFLPPLDSRSYSRTGIVYDERMMMHASLDYMRDENETDNLEWENPKGQEDDYKHPEVPTRISTIYNILKRNLLLGRMINLECPEVEKQDAIMVHSEEMWEKLQATSAITVEEIKATWAQYEHHSLFVNAYTALASRLSCGGVLAACEAVVTGRQGVRNAFAVVRPPGHHAEPDHPMGFCFLNNVAVAVNGVRRKLGVGKVMILDWDVHHGNGTQRAFLDDPNVLYISLHRHEGGRFYPCSDFGALDVTGRGAGEGTSVNVAWPKGGMGDADYLYAFQRIIMPIAYEFAPELVIISAGFDAAMGDELGMCHVTPAGYAHMTHMLMGLAGGRVVVALEGGYNLVATANSALAVTKVLLGDEIPDLPPMEASDIAVEVIYQLAKIHSKYWRNIDVRACEPLLEGSEDDEETVIHIPDILKRWRSQYMYENHGLFRLPIADPDLEKMFPEQILTDGEVYAAETVVLFVHDFGNLQVENVGALIMDCDLEKSYLRDCSNKVVRWIKSKGYSIIDVNCMKALATHRSQLEGQLPISRSAPKPYVMLMRYLWDNYIELTPAKNIILIGFGSGCQAVMSLMNDRDVEGKVNTIIQVGGLHTLVRPDPDQDDKRAWFRKHSRLYIPSFHHILDNEKLKRRLATQIVAMPHKNVSRILSAALPDIEAYVASILEPHAIPNGVDGIYNGVNGLIQSGAAGSTPLNGPTNRTSSVTQPGNGFDIGVTPMDLS